MTTSATATATATATADLRPEATIELQFPVEHDGERIERLTLRRPKLKDQLAAKKLPGNDEDRGLHLFARLCSVAPEALGELDQFDFDALQAQYASFTAR